MEKEKDVKHKYFWCNGVLIKLAAVQAVNTNTNEIFLDNNVLTVHPKVIACLLDELDY